MFFSSIKTTARKLVFWNIFYLKRELLMEYILLENSAISSCEILGSQRKLLFSRFLAVFLQIHPKPKVATMSSQRPSQGPLTWIVQFDCKALANTTKIWQFQSRFHLTDLQANLQSKSNLLRLHQLLFQMAPGDP